MQRGTFDISSLSRWFMSTDAHPVRRRSHENLGLALQLESGEFIVGDKSPLRFRNGPNPIGCRIQSIKQAIMKFLGEIAFAAEAV
jgi:hypothetical protein